MVAAAAIFLFGALALETVGSAMYGADVPDGLAGAVALLEESLEVLGTVVALWAIVDHAEQHLLPAAIRGRPGSRAAGQEAHDSAGRTTSGQ